MFSKIEIAGIALSITAMAAALYIVTSDTKTLTTDATDSQAAAVGTVVVESDGDNQQNIRDAVTAALSTSGAISKLIIDDVVIGTGAEVKNGDTVTVHYIGTLQNGQEFDNSNKRGQPFTFTVGEGKVIKGWEQGILGMKANGKRIIVIPSDLGYGDAGYGPIPGGASLVFALELVSITPATES